MTPIISPTTEKELMKDLMWITKASSSSSMNSSPNLMDEDNTTIFSPTWEENYQDLSGWCSRIPMDHRSYSFPVGESLNGRHSDMKIDDQTYSTNVGVEVLDVGMTSATIDLDDFKQQNNINNDNNLNNSNNMNNIIKNNKNVMLPPIDDDKPIMLGGNIDVLDEWLDLPKSSIASRTDEWIRLVDNDKMDEPLQRLEINQLNDNFNLDNSYSAEPTINWDIINNFDNNKKDFDLLSYLCDDNLNSPESISTDSIDIYQASTSYINNNKNEGISTRVHNTRNRKRNYSQETITSPSKNTDDLDIKPLKPSFASAMSPSTESSLSGAGSTKTTTRAIKLTKTIKTRMKKEVIDSFDTQSRRGRKRQYDSESEGENSDSSYRESREKNNEASRKSRMNKKAKEKGMMMEAVSLDKTNRILKSRVEQLEKMVLTMRAAILKSALRRNF
ncbi:GATA zinc finger domain-containing protein 8-like [Cotesia glomerata]|uniref:GATA zinc finger domain-containing protein 8-like n=1 Tax=Cotesia glomerata TaxID=32391 RepID=UPI001D00C10D|nr:GATA zinc finger domain-containing protein 8-like [Cotesia glomerata]XP_044593673.1 GATA zinc finger domain-containing protein 8-like [Cotesia glomerata]